jgi:putative ABC transport system permease protein
MFGLVLKTFIHFRGLLLPVALGVAVACAVIVGALVVGDSMRGSLRFIAMDRIGSIEHVIVAPRWFNEQLSQNLKSSPSDPSIHPLVYVRQAIAERQTTGSEESTYRASELGLFGVDESFWGLGTVRPSVKLQDEQVVLNQALADKLHANVGDTITLRVASQSIVPADSPLGKREQDSVVLPRWKVVEILPDQSIARFSLRSDQRPVMNAFVDKSSLQRALEIEGKINAVFIAGAGSSILQRLSPSLADLGLKWQHVRRSFPDNVGSDVAPSESKVILDYHQLTTDQMLIVSKMSKPMLKSVSEFRPKSVLTYLANGVQLVRDQQPTGREIPYSTISAVDASVINTMLHQSSEGDSIARGFVPEFVPEGQDWVVITSWLADDLQAKVGDLIRIAYYLPETVDGKEIEKKCDLKIAAIAPLTTPSSPFKRNRDAQFDKSPTPFNDTAWTPVVPGITDQDSISKWDTPFPLDRTIETQDDDYWNAYRLTPKLYVSPELGLERFGSRFGEISSIRFDGLDAAGSYEIETRLLQVARQEMASLGWYEVPIKLQQLRAASGTTPFDALFMSLSFFVIVAGLLLVALLFRLSIEQRADHWGLLLASGWTRASVRRWLLLEGALVSGLGASVGIVLGLLYAYAMISGLRSWWVGAIAVSFLDYHVRPISLVLGWLFGWLAAIGTIYLASRQLRKTSVAKLLRNQFDDSSVATRQHSKRSIVAIALALLGIIVLLLGQLLQGQAQAGAFVGGGMLFLIAGLAWVMKRLKWTSSMKPSRNITQAVGSMITASSLASSNAKRAPVRSILAIGLVAIASFLILSMSLFQAAPNDAGTGRFALIGKSSHAIHKDMGNEEYRRDMLGKRADALQDFEFVPLRVRGGDDASCSNLFQASEPQVLGVPSRLDAIDRQSSKDLGVQAKLSSDGPSLSRNPPSSGNPSQFGWFATGGLQSGSTPWQLLEGPGEGTTTSPIPVVLDQNTALWALHLGGYVGERFHFDFDEQKLHFVTVGVLQNTILQGSLLIGESNFEKVFPSVTGYRMVLIKERNSQATSEERLQKLSKAIQVAENVWSDSGLSLVRSDDVLRQLLAVQNTYLGAFQVLGALGLFLGTVGLGVSQVRSAMERRGELAAMRAIGFSKSRLVWLLTLENGWQLIRGIGIGVGSAALATLPALLNGQAFGGLAWPITMLGIVILSGLLCGLIAAWVATRLPLLQALRADR